MFGLEKENLTKLFKIGFLCILYSLISSCGNDLKDINRINQVGLYPTGEAHDMDIKYTEEGKIQANLKTATMYDFSTAKYPFNEFPEKVYLTVYNEKKEKTFLEADQAIANNTTKVIEFMGKVKVTFPDKKVLETNLLYFDQMNNWFYTERYFKIKGEDSYFEGIGLDFDSEFKIVDSQQNRGEYKNLKNEDL